MRLASALIVLALVAPATGCGPSLRGGAPQLAVTRAVLYQNGIGYFERRGRVRDDVLRMHVRPDQIRDVLKSLTVVELRAGRPVSIALPIEKSRARQISELPEQVRTHGGVLAIAEAFRGARCVVVADQRATGRIVGVENLGGEGDKADWRLSLLTDGGAIKQVRVGAVTSLEILDSTLEIGLRKALDASLDAGSWKPVELAVRLAGDKPHDLVVSYVVEMPTWKPAYRIVTGGDGRALLQGWAVIDNVSGDDWRGVKLSLTAGTPLAFIYDLYTPRFPQRPELKPRDVNAGIPLNAFEAQTGIPAGPPAPAPPSWSASGAAPAPSARPYDAASVARARKAAAPRALAPAEAADEAERAVSTAELESSYRAMVEGRAVGSLFRYDIEDPVTIDERQSALVNIVNARVPGEDVLLFRVGADATSPYRAVRFKNDSGLVLEAGPIAIYRGDDRAGGTFLGEALAGRIEKDANTFVPYAQDGRVRVTLAEELAERGVTLVKISRGIISVQTKKITRYSYDVDNGSGEAATLYVRRERRPGWRPVPKQAVIEEGGAYYLPIRLAAAGRTKVTVEEESPLVRDVSVFEDLARQVIALYLSSASVDPKVAAPLREVLALRERVGQLDAQIQTLTEQRELLSQRQQEVRSNLQVLGRSSKNEDLKAKLEATLAELDGQLNDVTRKLVQRSMERGEARDRVAALLKSVTLESASAR